MHIYIVAGLENEAKKVHAAYDRIFEVLEQPNKLSVLPMVNGEINKTFAEDDKLILVVNPDHDHEASLPILQKLKETNHSHVVIFLNVDGVSSGALEDEDMCFIYEDGVREYLAIHGSDLFDMCPLLMGSADKVLASSDGLYRADVQPFIDAFHAAIEY